MPDLLTALFTWRRRRGWLNWPRCQRRQSGSGGHRVKFAPDEEQRPVATGAAAPSSTETRPRRRTRSRHPCPSGVGISTTLST